MQPAAVRAVQTDHDVSTGSHETTQALERETAIGGVMEHAVADHHLEEALSQGRSEKVHLCERSRG